MTIHVVTVKTFSDRASAWSLIYRYYEMSAVITQQLMNGFPCVIPHIKAVFMCFYMQL